MKLKAIGFILLCLMAAGCLDGPKMISPFSKSSAGAGQIPRPYYAVEDPWLDQSVFGIEKLIGPGFLRRYSTNAFDCSEMAAYLEWMLEKHGFDAKVCLASHFGKGDCSPP